MTEDARARRPHPSTEASPSGGTPARGPDGAGNGPGPQGGNVRSPPPAETDASDTGPRPGGSGPDSTPKGGGGPVGDGGGPGKPGMPGAGVVSADAEPMIDTPVWDWIQDADFKTTEDIAVPPRLLDQVIGQDHAVTVVRKAAEQKRHVMMIGDPGTGKSMLARAMTEFLPKEDLEDIIAYPNPEDQNQPRIRVVPSGKGREIVEAQKLEARKKQEQRATLMMFIIFLVLGLAIWWFIMVRDPTILIFGIVAALLIFWFTRAMGGRQATQLVPKLLVSHNPEDMPPFIDATAAHSGALLGDVRHDPFQAGGLETPAHDRVESGAIHKSHKGVLYIDEINTLSLQSQQHLLTAIQEKRFQITGQSERSSGAMVKTEPVPCDFILVAAGNLDAVSGMHPALRSRVRGYGYEVYVKSDMRDTDGNRRKLIRFVAQEVVKDKKIPHFDKTAVSEIIHEAQRRAGRKGKLTLRLRELGGLIRVAGDLAHEEAAEVCTSGHVLRAKSIARSLEQQVADRYIEARKMYRTFETSGEQVGMVNGLAVMSADPSMSEHSGIVLPLVAEVTPASSRGEGKIIATGKLGDIAKEAVQNVSAIVKRYLGQDVSNHDVHVQFVGTYEGVEGDSASISVATAVLSALAGAPVRQDIAMTGSLSVRGNVLPVGGVTAKIEAAAEIGLKKVLIPAANQVDVLIEDKYVGMIEIIPVHSLKEVVEHAMVGEQKKQLLKDLEAMQVPLRRESLAEQMREAVTKVAEPKPKGRPVPGE